MTTKPMSYLCRFISYNFDIRRELQLLCGLFRSATCLQCKLHGVADSLLDCAASVQSAALIVVSIAASPTNCAASLRCVARRCPLANRKTPLTCKFCFRKRETPFHRWAIGKEAKMQEPFCRLRSSLKIRFPRKNKKPTYGYSSTVANFLCVPSTQNWIRKEIPLEFRRQTTLRSYPIRTRSGFSNNLQDIVQCV